MKCVVLSAAALLRMERLAMTPHLALRQLSATCSNDAEPAYAMLSFANAAKKLYEATH